MTAILGISAFYHDAAATLVVDGRIVAAAQEERFTRKKHDARFPQRAVEYCLSEAGLGPKDVDYVGFYDKPLLTFERLLETYLAVAPAGYRSFSQAIPLWLREKLRTVRLIQRGLGSGYARRVAFLEHHESHAASAFFPSPFETAAILTMDGVGEWATASVGVGEGNRLRLLQELRFPHSLGMLYSAFTYYTGFRVNSGEYKLMGLAPYGSPQYADFIRSHLVEQRADGSFRLNLEYFNYCQGLTMTSPKFHRLFGAPPRPPESPIRQLDVDLAASIQLITEEIVLNMAQHVRQKTGMQRLCLAGGVALNCVSNGRLLREGPFEELWIQPAAGDAGGSLGVAEYLWYQLLDNPREPEPGDSQRGSLLGPAFSEEQIRQFLEQAGAKYRLFENDATLCRTVAELLASENVVGWMQGRMEFGPRALGSRSILGDPRSPKMQSVMNLKIKFRESFRPFAPSVLRERAADYFDLDPRHESPYMLLVADVVERRRRPVTTGSRRVEEMATWVNEPRSELPAITHVDFSARLQTVDERRHGRYYELLRHFEAVTGCPVLINTSFNVRGEPIVCTPADAYRCFMATNMDVLVLERFLLMKEDQPRVGQVDVNAHLAQFQLD